MVIKLSWIECNSIIDGIPAATHKAAFPLMLQSVLQYSCGPVTNDISCFIKALIQIQSTFHWFGWYFPSGGIC